MGVCTRDWETEIGNQCGHEGKRLGVIGGNGGDGGRVKEAAGGSTEFRESGKLCR